MKNQIYRLDHYLGKHTLPKHSSLFRYGKWHILNPSSNKDYVDHIPNLNRRPKIFFGYRGRRGAYYDHCRGRLRDVWSKNHLLQKWAALNPHEKPPTGNFTNEQINPRKRGFSGVFKNSPRVRTRPQFWVSWVNYSDYLSEPRVCAQKFSHRHLIFAFKAFFFGQTTRFLLRPPIYISWGG